jgi:PKD repeat protein
MKIRSLLVLLFLLPQVVFSQSQSPIFQDGKIWFKLTNEARVRTTLTEDPYKIPFNSIPGFEGLVQIYGVTNLSKPFHAAKTSQALQRTYLVEFSQYALVENFIKQLEAMKIVEYAEKVPLDHSCLTPNDPSYGSQWALSTIGAATAWDYFSAGSTTIIAIVDDAVERTHPDLSPNLWVNPGDPVGGGDQDGNGYIDDINGWDVGSNDNNPNPPNSSYDHGTHVAGISSARSNNGTGVSSIGFSCKIMCVKSTNTPTAITDGYAGIVYAAANGADVINMSWGGPTYTTTGQNVVNYAWGEGCILVAAAGNDNVSSQFYPAAFTNVISVASTASGDGKSSFSNYGSWIDISAPGSNIYSTTVGGTYGNKSGTSMASPLVAGLVGLMHSLNPGIDRNDLISCLYSTATNINAANPSYIGQLGAGRINAAAAMGCVAATLNNPPVANFVANYTTVTAGGQVTFTDLSTYTPTTWNWSFPGGTPASYSGQNPPSITYNTPGTYNVTLTASNANGANTNTQTNYITVSPAGGCYTVNYPIPGAWTLNNYYTGASVGADGWVNGNNLYDDQEKAMYFDMSAQPYTKMVQCYIAFGFAYSANPNKLVPIKVYDGTSGTPGAQIGTTYNLTMGDIMADVNGNYYTNVHWPTPITLPASKKFFVSVDVSNLQWQAGVHDTLSIVSNLNGQTTPSAIWDKNSALTWQQYTTGTTWNLAASLIMHPFLTNEPVNAQFTQSATTICQGEGITFDATGSTYQDTLLWVFPGGTPNLVSEDPNPTVIFNTPGTQTVTMYVVGGGCSELDSAEVNITVNPTPSITVTAVTNPICNGGSTGVTATGATSYVWSPGSGLSATTGSTVTANPTTTTTYNIAGTTAGCTSNTSIEIEVLDPPVAAFTAADDTIDCNTSVTYDGSGSQDVTSFAWSFTGGSPTTSNASGDNITYNTAGDFNVLMIVSNTCGSDTAFGTMHVLNNCGAGIEEVENGITGYFSYPLQGFIIESANGFTNDMQVKLFNELGQVIYARNANAGSYQVLIPTYELRAGMYIVQITGTHLHQSFKFIYK